MSLWNDFDNLSIEHRIVFALVSVFTAICALIGNGFYLCWYIRDSKLKGCFYMFIANLAATDFLFAVIMSTLNVATVLSSNAILCSIFRVVMQFPRQEMKLILVILTFDRIQLIKGIKQYRQFITDHNAKIMVVTSWAVSVLFCIIYALYLFMIHGNSFDHKGSVANSCHAFPTNYMDFAAFLNLLLDFFLIVAYVYMLLMCRKMHSIMSSIELQDRVEQAEATRLSPRESAAYHLQGLPPSRVSMESSSPKHPSNEHPLVRITESSSERVWEGKKGAATEKERSGDNAAAAAAVVARASAAITAKTDKEKEDWDVKSETKDVPDKTKQNVLFDKHTQVAKAAADSKNRMQGSQPGHLHYGILQYFRRDSGDRDLFSPVIKSRLPTILAKATQTNSWRSETIAARQLGIFLCLHLLTDTPADVCYLLGSFWVEDKVHEMSTYLHWFLWLSILRSAIFPIVYCFYSSRLRSHLKPFFCFCCSTKVSPSHDMLDVKKSSADMVKK